MNATQTISIAVCGSNAANSPTDINDKAYQVGQELAASNVTVFSGVTTGYSYQAIKGAKAKQGTTIGISGAESQTEHETSYEDVDLQLWDQIIYTGVGYKMRDIIMIRSVDAAIYIGGGVGTLVEMAAAPDQKVIMGILTNSGGATEMIDFISKISHRNKPIVIKNDDPQKLVYAVIAEVKKVKKHA